MGEGEEMKKHLTKHQQIKTKNNARNTGYIQYYKEISKPSYRETETDRGNVM